MSDEKNLSSWQRAVAVLEDGEVVEAVQSLFTLKDMGLLDVPDPGEEPVLYHFLEVKAAALLAVVMPVVERRLRGALGLPQAPAVEQEAPDGEEKAARP